MTDVILLAWLYLFAGHNPTPEPLGFREAVLEVAYRYDIVPRGYKAEAATIRAVYSMQKDSPELHVLHMMPTIAGIDAERVFAWEHLHWLQGQLMVSPHYSIKYWEMRIEAVEGYIQGLWYIRAARSYYEQEVVYGVDDPVLRMASVREQLRLAEYHFPEIRKGLLPSIVDVGYFRKLR